MKQFPLFLLLLCIISCTKSSKTDNLRSTQLIPLAIGNQWVYAIKEYDTLGNLIPFSPSVPILKDTLTYMDTMVNDTTWYTNLPYDSSSYVSTATKVFNRDIFHRPGTIVFLASTDKDSEVIYQPVSNMQYGKLVVYNKTFSKNGYDVIKNVDTSIYNNTPYAYDEYYIKPGLGIVEVDYYWANYHADGSESFSLRRKQTLESFSIH